MNDEIVAYELKDLRNLPRVQTILTNYLIDNDIWQLGRDMTKEGKNFAKGSAFYDVFVRNCLLNELYKPIYDRDVNKRVMKKIQLKLPKGFMNTAVTFDNHFVADTNDSANWDTLKFPLPAPSQKTKWAIYSEKGKIVTLIEVNEFPDAHVPGLME